MALAVVHRGRVEFREPAVRHVAHPRLAATVTATDAGLRYRERAVHGGDVVVARLRAVIERVGEGVFAHSYGSLRARVRNDGALAVGKPVAANRHLVRRKRCPVVDLRVTLRGERNRAQRDPDADRADNRRVVRSRDPIPHLRVADIAERRRHIRPDVGLAHAVLHHRCRQQPSHRHGDTMRRAIVDVRVADRRDNAARSNRNRCGNHRDPSRHDRERVVLRARARVPGVVERVGDFALGDRRHRRPVRGRDALARNEPVLTFA